jgi:MoaA/NifB/PqqE/SkfB family radical SAM enzyme
VYSIGSIVDVHLEITSKCSVRCPQCPRNTDAGVTNPSLPQVELMLDDVIKIFRPSFIAQLRCITLCGNYGDPAVAQDTLSIAKYFRKSNSDIQIQMNSHGSARPESWWRNLAGLGVVCHFSIDGLRDTNHIYRRGAHWETIIRNAKAFIDAGGAAVWDFIIFAHNEHQIEEAEALSTELGFERFILKKTVRFMRQGKMISDLPIYGRRGTITSKLGLPKSVKHQNDVLRRMDEKINTWSDYEGYIENTPVACKAVAKRGIYVSAEGLVFPCCYLGHIYPARSNLGASQMADVLDRLPGGKSSVSALLHPLEDIVSGLLFQTVVPDGWRPGRESRFRTCSQQCGAYDLLSAQCG